MSFIGSTTTVFKRWMRKGRMPAKHGKKDYIKGTGGGSMGQFIKGHYHLDPRKIRTFVAPASLSECKLKAYVSPIKSTTNKAEQPNFYNVSDFLEEAVLKINK